MSSNHEFLFDDDIVTSACEKTAEALEVTVGETTYSLRPIGDNLYSATLNGKAHVIGTVEHDGTYYVDIDSVLLELKEPSEDGFAGGAAGAAGEKDKVYAPMPGKIVKVEVAVGDEVTEKQSLVIVEAMKMENKVVARASGTVKAVNVAAGDQVDTETPLVELDLGE